MLHTFLLWKIYIFQICWLDRKLSLKNVTSIPSFSFNIYWIYILIYENEADINASKWKRKLKGSLLIHILQSRPKGNIFLGRYTNKAGLSIEPRYNTNTSLGNAPIFLLFMTSFLVQFRPGKIPCAILVCASFRVKNISYFLYIPRESYDFFRMKKHFSVWRSFYIIYKDMLSKRGLIAKILFISTFIIYLYCGITLKATIKALSILSVCFSFTVWKNCSNLKKYGSFFLLSST